MSVAVSRVLCIGIGSTVMCVPQMANALKQTENFVPRHRPLKALFT